MCTMNSALFVLKMDTQEKILCRLCLKICENFEAMTEDVKDVLDVLLPKTHSAAIQEPMMCTNCAKMLMKCFDFKAKCFYTLDYIVPFVNSENAIKLDLTDVYLSKTGTSVPRDQGVCGFCMSLVRNSCAISLDAEESDVKLKNMIEHCLPELNLSIIEKPVICVPCHGSLESCFLFVTKCLIVEERIEKYCETQGINSKDRVELSSLLQSEMRGVPREVDSNSVNTVKVEKRFCEEIENADDESIIVNRGDILKSEETFCDDCQNADEEVDHKNKDFMNTDDLELKNEEQFSPATMLAHKDDSNKFDTTEIEQTFCGETRIKEESVEVEDQKCLLSEEIEIKTDETDFSSFRDAPTSPQMIIKTVYKCGRYSQIAKYKSKPKQHMLAHQEHSEVTVYRCDSCSYVAKQKSSMKTHMLTHRELSKVTGYRCDSCSYVTNRRYNLRIHMLTHLELSEVTAYRCDSCSYVTNRRYNLRLHMLTHRGLSEVTVYRCDSCSYVAKRKNYLRRHMLTHRELSEVTVYKCDSCSYVAKRKYSLKKHMLNHQDLSEITVYKCDSCSYVAKQKGNLKIHMLTHRDPSEVTVYKCDSCSYVAKQKGSLKIHMLTHQDLSEVTVYKCDSCSYVSKHKSNLKIHLLTHQDLSEVTVHKCDSCSYVTKRKYSLKKHMLTHRELSEVKYTSSSSYIAKQKGNLKKHMLTHRELSEVKGYKCDPVIKVKASSKRLKHTKYTKILQKGTY